MALLDYFHINMFKRSLCRWRWSSVSEWTFAPLIERWNRNPVTSIYDRACLTHSHKLNFCTCAIIMRSDWDKKEAKMKVPKYIMLPESYQTELTYSSENTCKAVRRSENTEWLMYIKSSISGAFHTYVHVEHPIPDVARPCFCCYNKHHSSGKDSTRFWSVTLGIFKER